MRRSVCLGILGLGLLASAGASSAADRGETVRPARRRLGGVADSETLRRAVRGAADRLHRPSCRQVLSEFSDGQGHPLADRLASLGTSVDHYLDDLLFVDGAALDACQRRDVLAFTSPGARTVHICAAQFANAALHDPFLGQAIVIHEMLHTLGLGEDPPTSQQITSRVLQACRG